MVERKATYSNARSYYVEKRSNAEKHNNGAGDGVLRTGTAGVRTVVHPYDLILSRDDACTLHFFSSVRIVVIGPESA